MTEENHMVLPFADDDAGECEELEAKRKRKNERLV